MPFETIDLVLGNDVAGKKVVPDGSEQPLDSHELSKLEKEYPEVFTACVVTRAQSKREAQKHSGVREPVEQESQECSSIDLVDTVLAQLEGPSETNTVLQKGPAADVSQVEEEPKEERGMEVNPVGTNQCQVQVVKTSVTKTAPVGPESIPLNRQALVEEQQKDPSLAYDLKVATCVRGARDVPTGYFVRDGILFQKWRPAAQPANEEWTVHEQVALPLGYRQEVMQLAHDSSLGGHLGTKKTLERISRVLSGFVVHVMLARWWENLVGLHQLHRRNLCLLNMSLFLTP